MNRTIRDIFVFLVVIFGTYVFILIVTEDKRKSTLDRWTNLSHVSGIIWETNIYRVEKVHLINDSETVKILVLKGGVVERHVLTEEQVRTNDFVSLGSLLLQFEKSRDPQYQYFIRRLTN